MSRRASAKRRGSILAAFIAGQSRQRREMLRAPSELGVRAPARRNDLSPRLEIVVAPIERLKPASVQIPMSRISPT